MIHFRAFHFIQPIFSVNALMAACFLIACSMNTPQPTTESHEPIPEIVKVDSQVEKTNVQPIVKIEEPKMDNIPAKKVVSKKTNKLIKVKNAVLPEAQNAELYPKPSAQAIKADSVLDKKKEIVTPVLNHENWNNVLQKFVSATGRVDYKSLKADQKEFNSAIQTFAENTPQNGWTRDEKLAYWINTYNAFTIKLILDNYPLKKITDLDGGKTWDVKRIELGGKKYSLNQIENEIIRPKFKDARIHFAVNCGAKSCPPLFNQAFLPETLDQQLTSRARVFIRNEKFNQIDPDKAVLSKIFEWYSIDFGDVKTYLNQYLKAKISETATVTFNEYDWNLNE